MLSAEEAKTKIIKELVDKIGELASEEAFNEDSTDRISTKIREIFDPILEEFEELA